MHLWKQQKLPLWPGWSFRLLASAWPRPSCCSHLKSELVYSLFFPLQLCLSNKHFLKMKMQVYEWVLNFKDNLYKAANQQHIRIIKKKKSFKSLGKVKLPQCESGRQMLTTGTCAALLKQLAIRSVAGHNCTISITQKSPPNRKFMKWF